MLNSETMADTRDMYMVHAVFRREFAALPELVRGAAEGDTGRAELIAEHADIVTRVLEAHHGAEDNHLWPKLLHRGGEEVAPVVSVMEGHHERIGQLIPRIYQELDQWRGDASVERGGRLADLLDTFNELLYEHLGMEEARILPLAEKYVTQSEWHEQAASSGAKLPPGKVTLIFGMTAYEADPEVLANTLATLPPEMAMTLKEEGRRVFAEHSERIHGTRTPRRSGPLKRAKSLN